MYFCSGMYVRNSLVSTQWRFVKGGLEYDNRIFSVTSFILDISVALYECLYTEN